MRWILSFRYILCVLHGYGRFKTTVSWWYNIPYGIPVLLNNNRFHNRIKLPVQRYTGVVVPDSAGPRFGKTRSSHARASTRYINIVVLTFFRRYKRSDWRFCECAINIKSLTCGERTMHLWYKYYGLFVRMYKTSLQSYFLQSDPR